MFAILFAVESSRTQAKKNTVTVSIACWSSVQTNDANRIIYSFIIVEFFGSLCTMFRKRLFVQTPVSECMLSLNYEILSTHKNLTTQTAKKQ